MHISFGLSRVEALESRLLLATLVSLSTDPKHSPFDPVSVTAVGNEIYFFAETGSKFDALAPPAEQLWKSDGTAAGTMQVTDDLPNASADGISGHDTSVLDGKFYFADDDSLWTTDGTNVGTVRVTPRVVSSLSDQTVVNGRIFFNGYDSAHGTELWSYDPKDGAVLVKDITPGKGSSNLIDLTAAAGALYFVNEDSTSDAQFYRSDGTKSGTVRLTDTAASNITGVGSKVFFTVGDQLWVTNGTAAGTRLVKEIVAPPPPQGSTDQASTDSIQTLMAANKELIFTVENDFADSLLGLPDAGEEIWQSDGRGADTVQLPNPTSGPANPASSGTPLYFFQSNASASNYNREIGHNIYDILWRSDGTDGGTLPVRPMSDADVVGAQTIANGKLYFFALDLNPNPALHVWQSDGSDDGTFALDGAALSTGAYFSSEQETGYAAGQLVVAGSHLFATTVDVGDPVPVPMRLITADLSATGTISGQVYNDSNRDGIRDIGESTYSNQTVFLDLNHNGKWNKGEPKTATDGDGGYRFNDLAPGNYDVRFIQTDRLMTTPASVSFHLGAGQSKDIDFGMDGARISGSVVDPDNNAPLGGFRIFLDLNGDGIHQKKEPFTYTSDDGRFSFNDLPAGKYQVVQTTAAEYSALNTTYTARLTAGRIVHPLFTDTPLTTASVHGIAYVDEDNNGQYTSGADTGIEGLLIYLDVNRDGKYVKSDPHAVTNADGKYYLDDISPGSYTIRALDYQNDLSPDVYSFPLTLAAGQSMVRNFEHGT